MVLCPKATLGDVFVGKYYEGTSTNAKVLAWVMHILMKDFKDQDRDPQAPPPQSEDRTKLEEFLKGPG